MPQGAKEAKRFAPGALIASRYRLEQRLGAGAMGEVWRARHEELNTDVAVKLALLEEGHEESILERFRLEAQVSAQLSQRTEHIVAVHDAGRHEGTPYLVMEYVRGKTLEELVASQGPLSLEGVAQLIEQCAAALSVAHDNGIWHRDIKCANIMVMGDEAMGYHFKVADFGVAKALDDRLDVDTPRTTIQGSLVGTPGYMSPEQVAGDPPSAASDLWSLAVTAYEATSGALPFEADSVTALLGAIVTRKHQTIGELVDVPPAVAAWFDRALAKRASERFPDASAMAEAFRSALEAPAAPPRRKRWVAIPVVGIGVGGALALGTLILSAPSTEVQRVVREPRTSAPLEALAPSSPATAEPAPSGATTADETARPPRSLPPASPAPPPTAPTPPTRLPKPYDPDETQ